MFQDFPSYTSPTLLSISEHELVNPPPVLAACRHCPASIWLVANNLARCYCTRMHLMTWGGEEPAPPEKCDGQIISLAQLDKDQKDLS